MSTDLYEICPVCKGTGSRDGKKCPLCKVYYVAKVGLTLEQVNMMKQAYDARRQEHDHHHG